MKTLLIAAFILTISTSKAQSVKLEEILNRIQTVNPLLKMYDADIRSFDEAAKGAKSWMAPELSSGFWMVPYNPSLWKKQADGTSGMGQFMISAQQVIPNPKRLNADAKFMESMSSIDKEKKKASLNELYAEAKKNYYDWMIIIKKLSILDQDEKLLDFMIRNAELRYKNGLEKISAYYKAKAAIGNIQNMRIMQENEIKQKRIALNSLMFRDKDMLFERISTISLLTLPHSLVQEVILKQSKMRYRLIIYNKKQKKQDCCQSSEFSMGICLGSEACLRNLP